MKISIWRRCSVIFLGCLLVSTPVARADSKAAAVGKSALVVAASILKLSALMLNITPRIKEYIGQIRALSLEMRSLTDAKARIEVNFNLTNQLVGALLVLNQMVTSFAPIISGISTGVISLFDERAAEKAAKVAEQISLITQLLDTVASGVERSIEETKQLVNRELEMKEENKRRKEETTAENTK